VSTRSVIARPTPDGGFHGTYCHNDGYPAHQGRILFDAVTGNFDGDPDAACRYLIDQHPAGWSVLHGRSPGATLVRLCAIPSSWPWAGSRAVGVCGVACPAVPEWKPRGF
jgi:hypothetical protein